MKHNDFSSHTSLNQICGWYDDTLMPLYIFFFRTDYPKKPKLPKTASSFIGN